MQIKILTEAGPTIGYGHLSRCSSLYDAAIAREIAAELIVYGDVGDVNFLGCRQVKSIDWMDETYIEDNIKETDYVIIDSYLASEEIYRHIARKAKKALYIDDTNRITYPPGIIVNPALGIGDLKYDLTAGQELYYGAEYVILRDAFHNVKRTRYRDEIEKVLITMGGTDTANVTPHIIDSLCSAYLEIDFAVVVSQEKLEGYQVQYQNSNNIKFHANLSAEDMRDLMLQADFAITAAGQTIYELIATQTPFIPIKVAENQVNNINALYEQNLMIECLDYLERSFIDKLGNNFQTMMNFDIRKTYQNRCKNIIDGKGAQRIIDKIIIKDNMKFHLRKASYDDCNRLFDWANDELVRKNSFNTGAIIYEDHKKWFENKIDNINSIIFIAMINDILIGQIRIDIDGDIGIIDYSIDYKYRGKGLGTQVLETIKEVVKSDYKHIKKLLGKVKHDNYSSQRAFRNAEFKNEIKTDYLIYYFNLYDS